MSNTDSFQVQVLYQDKYLLVADKPPGCAVQADRTGDAYLLQAVQAMLSGLPVGSPHRLDRPVSGVTLFTLDAVTLRAMDAMFREKKVLKTYLAIVEGNTPESGVLLHRLGHAGGKRKAHVTTVAKGEQGNAELRFITRGRGERYSLLEIVPAGGAFHQIRAQLGAAGYPIKGDVKYGARRGEPDRSIALHAWRLSFIHPGTGMPFLVEAPPPTRSVWPVMMALWHQAR